MLKRDLQIMGFFLNIKVIQQQTDSTTKRSLKKNDVQQTITANKQKENK